MIDGQHRCTVIVQTDIPLVMRVTTNASDESYLVIDCGSTPKSLDDALHHEGLTKGSAVLAAGPVRMLFREQRDVAFGTATCCHPMRKRSESIARHPGIVPRPSWRPR